jgi:hypothetical protein
VVYRSSTVHRLQLVNIHAYATVLADSWQDIM